MGLGYSYYVDGALAWFDDGEEGAVVGQEFSTLRSGTLAARLKHIAVVEAKLAANKDPVDFDYFVAEIAVAKFVLDLNEDHYELRDGWVFASQKHKTEAMKIAKAAVTVAKSEKPWPEWAVTALANGWKAPKNWKP